MASSSVGKQNGNLRASGLTALVSNTPRNVKTLPQVFVAHGALSSDELPNRIESGPFAYRLFRLMRADPTISLAQTIAVAPIVSAGWSVEQKSGAPEGAKDFIIDEFERHEIDLLYQGMISYSNYGWASLEKIHKVDEDGMHRFEYFKPLLQHLTKILVDPRTGELVGIRQYQRGIVDLDLNDCIVISFDVEGTDFYGRGAMEAAKLPYERWHIVEAAAARYDAKLAGSNFLIKYPPGSSLVGGVEMDNAQVANNIVATLQSSGAITVPHSIAAWVDDSNKGSETSAWSVEILSDKSGAVASFVERQKYLDSLKVRAMGFPERAMLEGQFGTKAESETHGDMAFVGLQLRHSMLTQQVNRQAVDQLLELNYGPEAKGKVYLVPNPVSDVDKTFLQTLYENIMKDPNTGMSEIGDIDTQAMRGRLGVPTKEADSEQNASQTQQNVMQPGEQNRVDDFARRIPPQNGHTTQTGQTPGSFDYAARIAGNGKPNFTGKSRAEAYDPTGPQITQGAAVGRNTAAASGPILTKQDVSRFQTVLDDKQAMPNAIINHDLLTAIGQASTLGKNLKPGVGRPQPKVAPQIVANTGDKPKFGKPKKRSAAPSAAASRNLADMGIIASDD